jgi:hypothetical protein
VLKIKVSTDLRKTISSVSASLVLLSFMSLLC